MIRACPRQDGTVRFRVDGSAKSESGRTTSFYLGTFERLPDAEAVLKDWHASVARDHEIYQERKYKPSPGRLPYRRRTGAWSDPTGDEAAARADHDLLRRRQFDAWFQAWRLTWPRCAHCGEQFRPPRRARRPRVYCTRSCQLLASRQHRDEDYRERERQRARAYYAAKRRAMEGGDAA